MKINYRFVLLVAFVLLVVSCTRSFNKVNKAVGKYYKGTYTHTQVDSVFSSLFKINSNNFQPSTRLKYEGAYVEAVYQDKYKKVHYHVLKFTDSCVGYRSADAFDLTPDAIAHDYGTDIRYSMQKGVLVYENVMPGFLTVRDIFLYGTISENGDTLTFYTGKGHENPNTEQQEVFIYHPEITTIPGSSRNKKELWK